MRGVAAAFISFVAYCDAAEEPLRIVAFSPNKREVLGWAVGPVPYGIPFAPADLISLHVSGDFLDPIAPPALQQAKELPPLNFGEPDLLLCADEHFAEYAVPPQGQESTEWTCQRGKEETLEDLVPRQSPPLELAVREGNAPDDDDDATQPTQTPQRVVTQLRGAVPLYRVPALPEDGLHLQEDLHDEMTSPRDERERQRLRGPPPSATAADLANLEAPEVPTKTMETVIVEHTMTDVLETVQTEDQTTEIETHQTVVTETVTSGVPVELHIPSFCRDHCSCLVHPHSPALNMEVLRAALASCTDCQDCIDSVKRSQLQRKLQSRRNALTPSDLRDSASNFQDVFPADFPNVVFLLPEAEE